jgi:flagellum-specific ATP synthase
MNSVSSKEHINLAHTMRQLIATYKRAEDMINIGAYKAGSNAEIDLAILKKKAIDEFLCQELNEKAEWQDVLDKMKEILSL